MAESALMQRLWGLVPGSARWRALLASVVLLVIIGGIATVGAWQLRNERATLDALQKRAGVVAALDDARANILLASTYVTAAVFADDPAGLQEPFAMVQKAVANDLEKARAGLEELSETEELAALDRVDRQLTGLEEDVMALIIPNVNAAQEARIAMAVNFVPEIWPAFESMISGLQELGRAQQEKFATEYRAANRTADGSFRLLTGISALAFIVAAGTVGSLSFSVVRPLAVMEAKAKAVAGGDLSVKADVTGPKEVRALAGAFNQMVEARRQSEQKLKHLAETDSLTGLYNHRSLQEKLRREVDRSLRDGHPLAVMMMDIDGFKLFNDTYGHQEGDRVLQRVAQVLQQQFTDHDVIGRYGGDEFLAILPATGRDAAIARAEKLFESISQQRLKPRRGKSIPLAISVGLAVCPDDSTHREELIAYADASLMEAKQITDGNLVVAHHPTDDSLSKRRTPFGVLDALVRAVDRKDRYTRRHSQQNAEFAVALGKSVGLSEGAVNALRIAGLLHDVGKIGIPDDVLRKPGPLTDEERAIMREHVVLGNLIVHGVPNLQDVSDAVYSHHERWDGSGYPRGLKGEEIPLSGRIMALVDAYSAMILDRPYRAALTHEEAIAELRDNAGTQFDPSLVEPFIALLEGQRRAVA